MKIDPIDFLKRHWGEIYTGIDILSDVYKGLREGGEIPETVNPKIKGILGLLGFKDERDFLLKLHEFKRLYGAEKFRKLMLYFFWETRQVEALKEKLGGGGAKIVLILYTNRLRTLFAGIPNSEGRDVGTRTRNSRRTTSSGTLIRESSNESIRTAGSQPAIDVLALLAEEIEGALEQFKDVEDFDLRCNQAFELVRAEFTIANLPRMPRPDEVPDLKGLVNYIKERGLDLNSLMKETAEALDHEFAEIEGDVMAWLDTVGDDWEERRTRPTPFQRLGIVFGIKPRTIRSQATPFQAIGNAIVRLIPTKREVAISFVSGLVLALIFAPFSL